MRKLKVEILPDGNVSVSGNAGLDLTYSMLFQSAATELQQGNSTIESGIRLIVFGCFWLEAECNGTLKKLLEGSAEFGAAGTALWDHAVERASFYAKFTIVSAFAKTTLNQSRITCLTRFASCREISDIWQNKSLAKGYPPFSKQYTPWRTHGENGILP